MESITRRSLLLAAGVSLAGCAGRSPGSVAGGQDDSAESTATRTTARGTPVSGLPLATDSLPVEYEFEKLRNEVLSGGPPKDGIPSIDDPEFWTRAEADSELDDRDVVFGLVRNGEVKAYPQKILVWHEIANDVVGGEPVTVSYCPLTGTAMGFRRGETTFGVSGKLLNNNLVMYDRETDSRWPQILGTAISGEFEGQSLQEFRLVWTRWADWKATHPDTKVLNEETGSLRNYGQDPYGSYVPDRGGYYVRDSTLFPALATDDRFPAKHVVLGARTEDGRVAFDKSALSEQGVLQTKLGGNSYLAVYDPALDIGYVYRNGAEASVEVQDGEVTLDGETHAPAELPLESLYAFDAMWFAWSGFYPSTAVVK
ncbi:DUF3179 domain-containing protein [Halorussus halophilus]|uniref:DUF3179 domain-containing protein n=1 Tax=Halorussus halophilus TaxID=2650975 RepID=UPI0013011570|nr:DUF3179 domain-containing protein [Halorussus halophilus]